VQWGASYLNVLIDLAPKDAATIEKTATQLFKEAAADSGTFDGRAIHQLRRVAGKLQKWSEKGHQAPVLKRLEAQLEGLCRKVDAASGQRAACQGLFKPAAKPEA
jgi:hypothetical protein